MRPIDADALEEVVQTNLRENPHKDGRIRAFHDTEYIHFLDVIRRMPTIAPPPNAPLTLEELRKMDGEPVWTAALDGGVSRWAFVSADFEVVRHYTTRRGVACDVIGRNFKTYGRRWLAYRRKPEVPANAE